MHGGSLEETRLDRMGTMHGASLEKTLLYRTWTVHGGSLEKKLLGRMWTTQLSSEVTDPFRVMLAGLMVP